MDFVLHFSFSSQNTAHFFSNRIDFGYPYSIQKKTLFFQDPKKGAFLHIYAIKCNYILYYGFFLGFTSQFWNIDSLCETWHTCGLICCDKIWVPKHIIHLSICIYFSIWPTVGWNLIHHEPLKSQFKVAKIRSEWQEEWPLLSTCKTCVIMYRRDLVRTNLRIWEHLLHIVDWAVGNPTPFKELQPLNRHFFWKPKGR